MNTSLHFLVLVCLALVTACREHIATEINVSYGEVHGHRLLLDIFRPEGKAEAARHAVIWIHGGAWNSGEKEEFHDIAAMLEEGLCGFFH